MSEPVVFLSLSERVSKFNEKANKHLESQSLNPFSGSFNGGNSRSPSPRPKFSKEDYGKPVAGSKTDLRGRKAHSHICKEILELCEMIHDVGMHNAKLRDEEIDDDPEIILTFGEIFQLYTKISDKVVGLLIAAKKRGFVYFEKEILFQRRDDDVLIALIKPIGEIKKILQPQISPVNDSPNGVVDNCDNDNTNNKDPVQVQSNSIKEVNNNEVVGEGKKHENTEESINNAGKEEGIEVGVNGNMSINEGLGQEETCIVPNVNVDVENGMENDVVLENGIDHGLEKGAGDELKKEVEDESKENEENELKKDVEQEPVKNIGESFEKAAENKLVNLEVGSEKQVDKESEKDSEDEPEKDVEEISGKEVENGSISTNDEFPNERKEENVKSKEILIKIEIEN